MHQSRVYCGDETLVVPDSVRIGVHISDVRQMHAHTETGEQRAEAKLQCPSRLELGSYSLRSKTTLTT